LAFEIAVGTPLVEHGIVDTALRALRLASGAVSLEEACRLVRSPYIAGARAERAPRGLFDLALRKCKLPQITPEGLLDEARKAKCPTLAKQLAAFAKHAAAFTEPHSASKWAQHFSAVLTALGWPRGNDEPRLSADEYQAHEAFLDLLRWFSALEVVRPTTISATQALSEFTRMVRDMSVRHKDSNAPVQVLSLADAPGCVFDHLWICGMTDDAWPPRGTSNPFIPVALQHKCALPHSSFALDNIEAAKTLARLYAGAPDVIVSWPKRDKDVELRPAPQIAELTPASVNFGEAVASMSALIPLAEADCFADEQAPAASPGRQSGGTKMFEYQSTCPFRAFVQTRLNARAMKEAYAGPNYIERGERIEKVLELVWNELGDSIRLHELFGTPELQLIVERAVDAAIREFVPQAGRWFDNYRVVERSRLVQLTLNWLDVERERAPFHSVVHQHETEIAVGELSIEARVDRMDKLPSGEVVIIDYKTGDNFSSKLWQTPRMDAPQLPLYAMTQAPGSVAAVAFGVVRTDGCDLAGITRDRKIFGKTSGSCEREMTREIAQWRTEMESLAAAYLAGEAAVDPKTAHKTCKWCHLKPVCRVAEGSSAEVAEGGNDA
jgi:probable DNA repair protein